MPSMSVHNGFMLWTLIFLFNFIRFVCSEQVLRNRQIKHRIEFRPVNVRKYNQKRSVRL